jgi:hypothetical protein
LRAVDGSLVLQVPTGQSVAATVGVAPAPYTPMMPLPVGRLRLTEASFTVWAADAAGTAVSQPAHVIVRPTAAVLSSVLGDPSQLVLAYLDPVLGWQSVPTLVLADGTLSASLPASGTVAIMRQAPTAWVQSIVDGSRFEVLAEHAGVLHVRAADGTLSWLDATLALQVPAPDAAPPLTAVAPAPASDAAPPMTALSPPPPATPEPGMPFVADAPAPQPLEEQPLQSEVAAFEPIYDMENGG